MKTVNKITVDTPVDDIWKILVDDFAKSGLWMTQVKHSYEADNEVSEGLASRICELSVDPNGLSAHESITALDRENGILEFEVVPRGDSKLPVTKNLVRVTMTPEGENQTRVVWESSPELKPIGKVLMPLIKFGITRSFAQVLEELKYYAENKKPHPRKVKSIEKVAKARGD